MYRVWGYITLKFCKFKKKLNKINPKQSIDGLDFRGEVETYYMQQFNKD